MGPDPPSSDLWQPKGNIWHPFETWKVKFIAEAAGQFKGSFLFQSQNQMDLILDASTLRIWVIYNSKPDL